MSNLLEHYKVLGVNVGAGIADITSSYRRLCRMYHPDVSNDPGSEELMKKINLAYTVLREKLRREAAFRERQPVTRQARRYGGADTRAQSTDTQARSAERKASAEAERQAFSVLYSYFKAISTFDYGHAYDHLSTHDQKQITRESFVEWRKSVARLYPLREFKILGRSSIAAVTWGDGKPIYARKFHVSVKEEDLTDDAMHSDDIEKLVINENGSWKVFLGYKSVGELTRSFDERYETKWKRDIAKRWEEYYSGLYTEYNMQSIAGMRKTISREIYRHRRYGGGLTFAVISIKACGAYVSGQEELLRSAARTICCALRETDVPAYAGDGVFAILFVELRKKNAEYIVSRLVEKIRKNAGPGLGALAEIKYEYETWSGHNFADFNSLNKVLEKFCKKM